jgi:hypothetical protein
MKLYRIKLSTKSPRYELKTFQLTAKNLEDAVSKAMKRMGECKFSKVENVDVFIETEVGGVWNSYLEQQIEHLNH